MSKDQHQQQLNPLVVYEDDSVCITEEDINIKKYYFPIPMSKNIHFSDVTRVQAISHTDKDQIIWGPKDSKWFNFDQNRDKKTKFIQLQVNKSQMTYPCFTPDNPQKVLSIIQNKLLTLKVQQNANTPSEQNKCQATDVYNQTLTKLGGFVQSASQKISQGGKKFSDTLQSKKINKN